VITVRLLVATTNADKLREIREILAGLDVAIHDLSTWPDLAAPDETGGTFAANAREKAVYYARATGMLTVAEDSGLEIDALDGQPGVHSARFGGSAAAGYPAKFALLYQTLAAKGSESSSARFVCALALARDEEVVFEARGTVEGTVAPEPRGDQGFGYDPIFYYPPFGCTLGEVPHERKAEVSHRGAAFRALRTFLERAQR
jgi:XTP/dITP diphosphohydrolase